uniref:Uncharacterized protein n=1 Tax=Anguilla anguilla TaxID=7936 RepID=A0A0E9W7P2_ANGAN
MKISSKTETFAPMSGIHSCLCLETNNCHCGRIL